MVRMLVGGTLLLLLLPILAPLILGLLVTRTVHGTNLLVRRLRSDRGRHE